MPPSSRIIWLTIVVSVMTALLDAVPAHAQFSIGRSSRNPDYPTMTAELGFSGTLWPNRWAPLTITLTGGAKPFDGAVSVAYAQDDRTGSQILRAVAATPGKQSVYHMLVNVPGSCSMMTIVLRTRGGREVARTVFSTAADTSNGEIDMPLVSGAYPIVLALGSPSEAALAGARSIRDHADNCHAVGAAVPHVAFCAPDELAPSWAALDSVLVVITSGGAAAKCDPRALAGVREWVSAGGRLVVLATGPGPEWREWLATSDAPVPVDCAPARKIDTPSDLAEALSWRPPKTDPTSNRQGNVWTGGVHNAPPRPSPKPQRDDRFSAASSMVCRPLSLTPAGAQAGWRLRFPIDPDAKEACIAEGPHGFGWITVVGFDPERVGETVLEECTRRVWYAVLENVIGDFRARELDAAPGGYIYDRYSTGALTVSDHEAALARNAALNAVSDVPSISQSVFPAVAAGIFILALLIGPIDAILLNKLGLRHRSWATAIGWIGLASVAAYMVPNLIRTGNTRVNRLTIVDAMQTSPDASGPTHAWRTGFTGVFAGESLRASFAGDLPGSWWRHASSQDDYYWAGRQRNQPRRSLVTLQAMPDLTALARSSDPWGGLGPSHPGAGGNVPAPTPLQVWTFRTFQDQARATTPIHARVEQHADGSWTIQLKGVPRGARITSAAMQVFDAGKFVWYTFAPDADSGTFGVASDATPSDKAPGLWAPLNPAASQSAYSSWNRPSGPLWYGEILKLPGPDRRTWGIEKALEHGCVALHLFLTDMPADVTLAAPGGEPRRPHPSAEYRHSQVCRLVVPAIRAEQPAPPTDEPETPK